MNMQCPKGSDCKETDHTVKSICKAKEWFEQCLEYDLPITVKQYTAKDGRVMIKVFNSIGNLIHQRG